MWIKYTVKTSGLNTLMKRSGFYKYIWLFTISLNKKLIQCINKILWVKYMNKNKCVICMNIKYCVKYIN